MLRQPLDYPLPEVAPKTPVADRLGKLVIAVALAYFGIHVIVAGVRHAF